MSSRGAWPYYYKLGLDFRSDPQGRGAYGIYAFKNELVYNGFATGIRTDLAYWGDAVVNRMKDIQRSLGVTADGVLGPNTARALFRKRTAEVETSLSIPAGLLSQIKTLESANDPVAQGYVDLNDEGLLQENLIFNPLLTQAQCWTPSFIISYAGHQLVSHFNSCNHEWKAATASWNIGNYYANKWRTDGYPASGGPLISNGDGTTTDIYVVATNYVELVAKQPL